MIKIGTQEVRNLPNELTITEFENISREFEQSTITPIESAKKILVLAGADLDELHEMTLGELKEAWLEWNKPTDVKKGLQNEIELNGKIYTAYEGDEFRLNSRDLGMIQSIVGKRKDGANFWHLILAVVFKDLDLTKAEHYSDAHIKHKAKLILENKISAEVVIPYVAFITSEMAKFASETTNLKKEEIEQAKELEGNNG